MDWININNKKPDYYTDVIIFDGEKIHYGWHRLSDGENEYYGSMDCDTVITNITHWRPSLEPPK